MDTLICKIKTLFRTGFFHIFGGSVINKVISFLSSVILVRILSKEEYGIFTYGWNIYGLLLLTSGLGLGSGVLQLISEQSGNSPYADRISNYGTRLGVRYNGLLGLLLLLIAFFAPLKIPESRWILFAVCLLPVVTFLSDMTGIYLRAMKRNQEYAKLITTYTAMLAVASIIGALLFRELGLVFGYYFSALASYLIGLLFFHVRIINNTTLENGEEKGVLLRISVISMVNNGLSQLLYLLDIFLLGYLDPQATILAGYKVATVIPTALSFIPQSLILYLYPYFAEHKDDGTWCLKQYKRIVLGFGSFNMLLSGLLCVAAPFVIHIMYGPAYLDVVPVFRLLAINYFFSGTFRTISGNLLVTQRKLKFNLFVAISSSLANIVADYFFILWWGSVGAALATLSVVIATSIVSTLYLILTFRKKQALFS